MNFMSDMESDVTVKQSFAQRVARPLLMFSVPAILLAVGLWFWLTSGRSVSTDNAQVVSHIVNVAPEVGGRIVEVHVRENQRVKAGDILYTIDPEP